jgi:hypothetical protein
MTENGKPMNRLLEILIELLDIPRSHYEKAKDRARSLEQWLHRGDSHVAKFSPDVYPQGSFRYGTVTRRTSGFGTPR